MTHTLTIRSNGHDYTVPVVLRTWTIGWPNKTITKPVGLDGYAPHIGPELLPLTVHERTEGWPFEVRDPDGPVYRANSRKACQRWVKHRNEWFARGRPFEYKSRYLDMGEGQLVFDEGGHSYGLEWHQDQVVVPDSLRELT